MRIALTLGIVLVLMTSALRADTTGYRLETVAEGLDNPWGIAFLPGGELLVTERVGALRRVSADGIVGPALSGVPPVFYAGQGGLLDVTLDPDFATNQVLYLSYAHGDGAANGTRLSRARLEGQSLEALEVLHTVAPTKDTPQHYGGALAWLPDRTLLMTTGDGFVYREAAQDRGNELGKTLRIGRDGQPPADNPFPAEPKSAAVYTYGHRNPQGLAVDGATGRVFQHEHGPRGGDELNLLVPGSNYGWPIATFGIDYTGARISPYESWPGTEAPLRHWVPSIGPSGLTFYTGELFPAWQGSLFLGALVNKEVRRLALDGSRVVAEEPLFAELGERIRNVKAGPDGALYLITDGPQGRIVRVVPK
ncbi:MAG TPA: glucose dehydrogenase [Gammaproteobacteria bacterium]|jgi:glucose/arabinose dehydrogenase|nr:glucose dehydrogenase [Gammaproteobacteria bacterium]